MSPPIRLEAGFRGDDRRWVIGVLVSSGCAEVSAALVGAAGRGTAVRAQVAGTVSKPVPRETAALLTASSSGDALPAAALALLRAELAEHQAVATADLLAEVGVAPSRVLAVGVHDPGIWMASSSPASGYLGLCDPARLAEATGINVVDAFPARDLTRGGLGGPVLALAEWVLMREPRRTRVLLDLGRTTRMTYLPRPTGDQVPALLTAFEVGPGTAMLDALAHRLTGGESSVDAGGRLAAQGRRIPELVDHWLADPYFQRPIPRWHPWGVRPERYLSDALRMAVEAGWSVRDVLCSATHLIAESIAVTIRTRLPASPPVEEILVTGGGQQNGMLLGEIARRTQARMMRPVDVGIPDEAFGAASVAVMALLYLDQVPANPPGVTGAEVPRLLGRLTPGSPQNWQRLLDALAGSVPPARPLRAAI